MTIKSALKTDWFFLLVIISLAILIRSLNFSDSLNFSSDQAKFSIKSLEILRGEINGPVLIGPSVSLQLEGKEFYQGGVIYYFQALFLFLGNLDPIRASYLFMLFSCLMTIPLYKGIKSLINEPSAKFVAICFCFLPTFISYTKFLWNPNFQLSLLPLFFLLLGLYKKHHKIFWLLLAGISFGIVFQFHYQLFIGFLLILAFMKLYLKFTLKKTLIFISGVTLGFLPMIIFELRNDFLNTNTLLFYFEHFSEFSNSNSSAGFFTNRHYFISLLLIVIVLGLTSLKSLNLKIVYSLATFLIAIDLFLYIPKPTQGFGMAENWSYPDELKSYNLIQAENIKSYNVTNLGYDTLAQTQKYLHKKDNLSENITDYWETTKLFVIALKSKDINSDPAYEVQVIKPYKVLKEWEINQYYKMYLLEKN